MKTKQKNKLIKAGTFFMAISLFWVLVGCKNDPKTQEHNSSNNTKHVETAAWTCSMHPDVHKEKPGECPICGMDLISEREKKKNKNTTKTIEYEN